MNMPQFNIDIPRGGTANSYVFSWPVPHFIVQKAIAPAAVVDMLGHWPKRERFRPEVPGNYVFYFGHDAAEANLIQWWTDFWNIVGRRLCADIIKSFRPWINKRYEPDVPILAKVISLMEADQGYPGHGVHTHHYHDPGWVATALFYLDDKGWAGTTLFGTNTDDIGEQALIAADYDGWRERKFEEVVTAEYGPGNLFAMYDSPISFHSVKPSLTPAPGARRIFRVHMGVADSHVEKIYGVPISAYRQLRRGTTRDPQVIGWLKRDIEEMYGLDHKPTLLG